MLAIPFIKMHGLGNSYVYIDTFRFNLDKELLPKIAQNVAKNSIGIGSDGLILIGPSIQADVSMRIFNKDGSEGLNCGNGLRCVAKYAYENKLCSNKYLSIETLSGIAHAEVISCQKEIAYVSVDMGVPKLARKDIPMTGKHPEKPVIAEKFLIDHHTFFLTAVSMGNPHAVFFINDPSEDFHLQFGPKIEKDPRFPEGINVEFVYVESNNRLHCKVWERGSGATQACGTGACASLVASVLNGHSLKGKMAAVHLEGGPLEITWLENNHIFMTGPAATIAEGVVYI